MEWHIGVDRRLELVVQAVNDDEVALFTWMSWGGGSFSPDDAYGSAWDSVLPMKGEYHQLHPVP